MAQLIEQLAQFVQGFVEAIGYPGIALLMFAENIIPPIPSEIIMPFSGFLVSDGKLNLLVVISAGTLGSVASAALLYYLGLKAGDPVIRRFIQRYGKWLTVSVDDYDNAIRFFQQRGDVAVLVGRLVPFIRSVISIPAGVSRMPFGRFLLLTALGSGLWSTLLAVGGTMLGANWEAIIDWLKRYESIVTLVMVALLVILVIWWGSRHWRRQGG